MSKLKADIDKPHRCPKCWSIYDEYREGGWIRYLWLHLQNLICPKCGEQRERTIRVFLQRLLWDVPKNTIKAKVWKYDMKLFRQVLPKIGYYSKRHFIKESSNDQG